MKRTLRASFLFHSFIWLLVLALTSQEVSASFLAVESAPIKSSFTLNDLAYLDEFSASPVDVENFWSGKWKSDKPLVILMQEAHGFASAQDHIQQIIGRILTHLKLKNSVSAIEGSQNGPIALESIQNFPDLESRTIITEHLYAEALIDGATRFAIEHPEINQIYGIDDRSVATEHKLSYQNFHHIQADFELFHKRLTQIAERLATQLYPANAFLLEKSRINLRENTSSLEKHLALLNEFIASYKLDASVWPSLATVLSKTSATAKDASPQDPLLLEKDLSSLWNDLKQCEEALWSKMLSDQKSQELHDFFLDVERIGQLARMELRREEYAELASQSIQEMSGRMQTFLKPYTFLLHNHGLDLSKQDFSLFEDQLAQALPFYQLAQTRDQILAHNLEALVESQKAPIYFVVFGGFHRKEIEDKLKTMSLPFFTLSPKISEEEQNLDYWHRLLSKSSFPVVPDASTATLKEASIFDSLDGQIWVSKLLIGSLPFIENGSTTRKQLRMIAHYLRDLPAPLKQVLLEKLDFGQLREGFAATESNDSFTLPFVDGNLVVLANDLESTISSREPLNFIWQSAASLGGSPDIHASLFNLQAGLSKLDTSLKDSQSHYQA